MLLKEKTQRNKESKQDVMREKTACVCVCVCVCVCRVLYMRGLTGKLSCRISTCPITKTNSGMDRPFGTLGNHWHGLWGLRSVCVSVRAFSQFVQQCMCVTTRAKERWAEPEWVLICLTPWVKWWHWAELRLHSCVQLFLLFLALCLLSVI